MTVIPGASKSYFKYSCEPKYSIRKIMSLNIVLIDKFI